MTMTDTRVRSAEGALTSIPTGSTIDVFDAVIVGAGFGGLSAVHELRSVGITNIRVIERADNVGGTWRDNTYPGAACDVPSHLYSLSFALNPNWSRTYSQQGEIQAYLERVAAELKMDEVTSFGCELLDAHWHEAEAVWKLRTSQGPMITRVLITAAGALADPTLPDVAGIDTLSATAFHSARWDHEQDLTGKRVAVIGTGASAIQIVPELQRTVGELHLFQRTPPWVLPRTDRPISRAERFLYRRIPGLQRAVRAGIYLTRELIVPSLRNPRLGVLQQRLGRAHLKRGIADRTLRRKVTPNYTIGCKRILLSNTYYPALAKDNVEVHGALSEVDGARLTSSDGDQVEVDAVVFCTGFAVQELRIAQRVFRSDGLSLRDHIRDGNAGLLGSTYAGFPNLFTLLGPNTGLGHTSQVFMIEAQARMAAAVLAKLGSQNARGFELGAAREREWADTVASQMQGTVWTSGGCASWYLDEDGRNTTLWPSSTIEFWRQTRNVGLDAFDSGRILT